MTDALTDARRSLQAAFRGDWRSVEATEALVNAILDAREEKAEPGDGNAAAMAELRGLLARIAELERWVDESFDALGYEETVWDGDDCVTPLPKVIARDLAERDARAEKAEAEVEALQGAADQARRMQETAEAALAAERERAERLAGALREAREWIIAAGLQELGNATIVAAIDAALQEKQT